MKKTIDVTKLGILFCLLLSLTPSTDRSKAQERLSASERSYQQARRALESGIQALGGIEAVSAIKSLSIIERRKGHDAFQSPTPGPPYGGYDAVERLIVDFSGSRLRHELEVTQPRYSWGSLTIINGKQGYRGYLNRRTRTVSQLNAPSLDDYRRLLHKLPQFLLLDALRERAASLRWVGEGEEGGRKQEIVTFIDRTNQQVALYFDARDRLLTKYEFLYTDPAVGDTRSEFVYRGYREVGSFKVPAEAVNRVGRHAGHETRYEILINAPLAESAFALPEGVQVVTTGAARATSPYTITQIAKDVYLVENVGANYNVMVVAFDDFLLVAEAPEDRPHAGLSERVIARIKETVPGKPIKYLVFSHHHLDHGCGARAYIAEGATVITTPGNKRFVEAMAAAPFTLKPDALALAPRPPAIELLEKKKRVIRDANHVVELYDVGPYWHANEEALVYLPQEKLLFEGDLFTSGFGEDVGPAEDHAVLLSRKIKELGLEVEKIAGVHGRLRPAAELYKSVEKRNRMEAR
jgi:glyoxylase-like metal-dependent hydrolase (beta-lactamase superfamily II)